MSTDLKFSEWRGDKPNRWRVLIGGTIECSDFFCEECGCCLHCNGDCCESLGKHPCWAVQYEAEAIGAEIGGGT